MVAYMKNFTMIVLALFCGALIISNNSLSAEMDRMKAVPQHKPKIIFQDDCYLDTDYQIEVISAKEAEKLLEGIIERKLR